MPKNEKKSTIESYAFIRWWEARRRQQPIPKNPYHAFMTDKALKATIPESQAEWRKQPNRRDLASIDLPPHVRRKMARKERKRPPMPKKKARQRRAELKTFIKELSRKEYIATPELKASPSKGYLESKAMTRSFAHTLILGTRGPMPLVKAMTAHELGHVKSHEMSKKEREEMEWKISGEPHLRGFPAPRIKEEKIAWEIAKKHFSKKPVELRKQRWLKRFALETYYQSPRYGIPRKQKMKWTVT